MRGIDGDHTRGTIGWCGSGIPIRAIKDGPNVGSVPVAGKQGLVITGVLSHQGRCSQDGHKQYMQKGACWFHVRLV